MLTLTVKDGIRGYQNEKAWYPSIHAVIAVLAPPSSAYQDEQAMALGSACHAFMADYLLGRVGEPPKAAALRIGALLRWHDTHVKDEPEAVEVPMALAGVGFAGTPDAVYRAMTYDWKFAESITLENLIQAEALRHLTARPVTLVQAPKDGRIILHRPKPNPRLWAAFLSALGVLKFRMEAL